MTSWAYLDESTDVTLSDADTARADAIAARITAILRDEERKGFEYDDRDYDYDYDYDPFEGMECGECAPCLAEEGSCTKIAEMYTEQLRESRAARAAIELELEWLDAQLTNLGCRMMRPYEHHNEDERWFELAESGNFPGLAYT